MNVFALSNLIRRPHVLLLVIALLAGNAAAADSKAPTGKGGKVKIENKSDKPRKLTQVVFTKKGQSEPVEIINFDPPKEIPANGSLEVQSTQFETPAVQSTTWSTSTGLVATFLTSTQDFALDTHDLPALEWTLMTSAGASVSYGYTAADLAAAIAVPEGQKITVIAGRDRSGYFPASVVFLDAASQQPYSGLLTSTGQLKSSVTWQNGTYGGGAGLQEAPQLEGSGDFTSDGTIRFTLSDAPSASVVVFVAGFSEVNLPFAGGVLGPNPQLVLPGLLADAEGQHELSIPLGTIRPDVSLYAQELLFDAGVTQVLACTNTVLGVSW